MRPFNQLLRNLFSEREGKKREGRKEKKKRGGGGKEEGKKKGKKACKKTKPRSVSLYVCLFHPSLLTVRAVDVHYSQGRK